MYIIVAVAILLTALIVAPLSWKLAIENRKKTYEAKIGSAETKSREIIEEAIKVAETKNELEKEGQNYKLMKKEF